MVPKPTSLVPPPRRRPRPAIPAILAALSILALVSASAVAQRPSPATCSAMIKDFGGTGDGVADDAPAIRRALASGCSVSGGNLTYRVTASLRLPDNTNLSDATFVQDIPANGLLRVLYMDGGGNLALTNIRVNRGSNPRLGTVADAAGIWIANATNVVLTDVEVTGDGPGTGIKIVQSRNVRLVRPHVHDMRWETAGQPDNEVMVGIWPIRSSNVTIDSPRIANLTPVAIEARGGRAAGRRNNMTDGLSSSGTDGLVINNPEIWNVGEGIDISGSHVTRNFTISGGNLHDIDSFCYKVTRIQGPGIIRNSVAARCGLAGYVVAGPVTGVQFINDRAIDIGSNGKWANPAGFVLMFASNAMPSNITIRDSQAIDSQATRTMKVGFRSERAVPGNRLINSQATGYVVAPMRNF